MENTNKLLYMAFSAFVFCLGLFLVGFKSMTYINMMKTMREGLKDTSMYQQFYPEKEEIVSYAKLMATLFQTLDYDINIDGLIINTAEHDTSKIEGYNIRATDYIRSYRYDETGEIIMVIYTGIS